MKWYPASRLAGLPELPKTAHGVHQLAARKGWISRVVIGRGGSRREYHRINLPIAALLHLRGVSLAQIDDTSLASKSLEEAVVDLDNLLDNEVDLLTLYGQLLRGLGRLLKEEAKE